MPSYSGTDNRNSFQRVFQPASQMPFQPASANFDLLSLPFFAPTSQVSRYLLICSILSCHFSLELLDHLLFCHHKTGHHTDRDKGRSHLRIPFRPNLDQNPVSFPLTPKPYLAVSRPQPISLSHTEIRFFSPKSVFGNDTNSRTIWKIIDLTNTDSALAFASKQHIPETSGPAAYLRSNPVRNCRSHESFSTSHSDHLIVHKRARIQNMPGDVQLPHAQEEMKLKEEDEERMKKKRSAPDSSVCGRKKRTWCLSDSLSDNDSDDVPPLQMKYSRRPVELKAQRRFRLRENAPPPVPPASGPKTRLPLAALQNLLAPAIKLESREVTQAREEAPPTLNGLVCGADNMAALAAKVAAEINAFRDGEARENAQLEHTVEGLKKWNTELGKMYAQLEKTNAELEKTNAELKNTNATLQNEMRELHSDAVYGRAIQGLHNRLTGRQTR